MNSENMNSEDIGITKEEMNAHRETIDKMMKNYQEMLKLLGSILKLNEFKEFAAKNNINIEEAGDILIEGIQSMVGMLLIGRVKR